MFLKGQWKGELTQKNLVAGRKIMSTLDYVHIIIALKDDMTNKTDISLLVKKTRVLASLKKYTSIPKVQRCLMPRFYNDKCRKFDSHKAKIVIYVKGIKWELTTFYNPRQNGVAKRCFWTVFEKTQTMSYGVGLSNNQ